MNLNKWKTLIKQIKIVVPIILYLIVLLITIRLYPVKALHTLLLIILTFAISMKLYKDIKNRASPNLKNYANSILKTALIVSLFYVLLHWLGGYGVLGLILIVIVYVVYRLVKGRKQYVDAMRTVETMTFGKTFDKKNKEM